MSRGTCRGIRANPSSDNSATNKLQRGFLECFADLFDGLVGVEAIRGDVNLLHAVGPDELPANLAELRRRNGSPPERFKFSIRPS